MPDGSLRHPRLVRFRDHALQAAGDRSVENEGSLTEGMDGLI